MPSESDLHGRDRHVRSSRAHRERREARPARADARWARVGPRPRAVCVRLPRVGRPRRAGDARLSRGGERRRATGVHRRRGGDPLRPVDAHLPRVGRRLRAVGVHLLRGGARARAASARSPRPRGRLPDAGAPSREEQAHLLHEQGPWLADFLLRPARNFELGPDCWVRAETIASWGGGRLARRQGRVNCPATRRPTRRPCDLPVRSWVTPGCAP